MSDKKPVKTTKSTTAKTATTKRPVSTRPASALKADVQMAETVAHHPVSEQVQAGRPAASQAQKAGATSQARPASQARTRAKPASPKKELENAILKVLKESWKKLGISGKVIVVLIVLGVIGKIFNYY